jgi:hypothetical protein
MAFSRADVETVSFTVSGSASLIGGDGPASAPGCQYRYDERGRRATFHTTGMEHSPTSATGTGWEPTPWHATQRAAWEALTKAVVDG